MSAADKVAGVLTTQDLCRPINFRSGAKEWRVPDYHLAIWHDAEYPRWGGFGEIELVGRPTARHTFQVALGSEFVDSGEQWKLIQKLSHGRWEEDRDTGEPRFIAAKLQVVEWSELHRANGRADWGDVLDSYSADAEFLYPFVSALTECKHVDSPLREGSLFLLDKLHVHPAFRGQDLGIRLMAHAILELQRSLQDVFACIITPIKSIFAEGEDILEKSPTTIETLTRYYERLGFERWESESGYDGILWHPGDRLLSFAG